MKARWIVGTLALVALAMLGVAAPGQADPPDKIEICHFSGHDGDFVTSPKGKCPADGNVIEVSENALCAHVQNAKACFEK